MTSQASHFVDMWLSIIYRPSKTNLKKTINLLQIVFSASSKQTKNWRSNGKKTINCEKNKNRNRGERKPDKTQLSVERGVTIRNFDIQATTALHNIGFSRKKLKPDVSRRKSWNFLFFLAPKKCKKDSFMLPLSISVSDVRTDPSSNLLPRLWRKTRFVLHLLNGSVKNTDI